MLVQRNKDEGRAEHALLGLWQAEWVSGPLSGHGDSMGWSMLTYPWMPLSASMFTGLFRDILRGWLPCGTPIPPTDTSSLPAGMGTPSLVAQPLACWDHTG